MTQPAPAAPVCAGAIAVWSHASLDAACFTMPGQPTPIAVGNLIMFHNINGTALEYVTAIAGQHHHVQRRRSAGLEPDRQCQRHSREPGCRRYADHHHARMDGDLLPRCGHEPVQPQLIRQVDYPRLPAAAPANPPQAVGEVIEDLSLQLRHREFADPAGIYGLAGPGNAPTSIAPDTPFAFRAVNVISADARNTRGPDESAAISPQQPEHPGQHPQLVFRCAVPDSGHSAVTHGFGWDDFIRRLL